MQAALPMDEFKLVYKLPRFPERQVPSHLPKPVEAKFEQAEESFMAGHFAAATSLFRTAIERALKAQFPEASGTLYERIKSAAAQEHFPAALIDWLNEVRFFGNAAVHDSEWEPTRDEAEQAREFANLFLTYAFTMPERAKRRA